MKPFELIEPRSLGEAIKSLDCDDPAVRPIAGGTALMLMMKSGLFKPARLVSLRAIGDRCTSIALDADGSLRIGAMTPLAVIERSSLVARHAQVIVATLRALSNRRIRNVATLGGHLAHADPHLDLPPVLCALNARLVIAGPSGETSLPIENLITGYFETALRSDQLIAEVVVPTQTARRNAYVKCTARSADDWPALGVAVSLLVEQDIVRESYVFVGAATAVPTRLNDAERVLRGARVDDDVLRRAGEAATEEADIIGDQHGSAPYKRQLLRVALGRAAKRALAAAP